MEHNYFVLEVTIFFKNVVAINLVFSLTTAELDMSAEKAPIHLSREKQNIMIQGIKTPYI
jgi:hypothetical protein